MKSTKKPALPLTDENGRFHPGVSALPAKRLTSQMWQLASLRHPGMAEQLRELLQDAAEQGVTWAHPAATNGAGASPLHIACIQGNKPGVAALLEFRGASAADFVDKCDSFGTSALMAAACRGRAGCVELLLLARANPNLKNKNGYTGERISPPRERLLMPVCSLSPSLLMMMPAVCLGTRAALEAAVDAGHSECAALLCAHGACPPSQKRPATARQEAKRAGQPFHWDRGLSSQDWWKTEGLPSQARKCRELEAQLMKHLLGAAPDAHLLETPLDRLARVERAHTMQFRKEHQRKATARQREESRQAQITAWNEKIQGNGLRRSYPPGALNPVAEVWTAP